MGIFSKMFSKTQTPEQIVNRTPADKLEALVKSSGDENVRLLAAGRLNREGIWQYLALHDPENARSAMRKCRDLQFLAKLCELRPEEEYPIREHMDEVAFPIAQRKIGTCDDQEKLLDLVMNGRTDIPEYEYLYIKSKDRIRDKALARIRKPEYLYRIAAGNNEKNALDAISWISDPEMLVRVALEPENNSRKKTEKVLSMLRDEDRLKYIAEHSPDQYTVQLANRRAREERSLRLCGNTHDWVQVGTETDDDGDSPRFDYVYEKCKRCGVKRCTTYIARRLHSAELSYDGKE